MYVPKYAMPHGRYTNGCSSIPGPNDVNDIQVQSAHLNVGEGTLDNSMFSLWSCDPFHILYSTYTCPS